MALSVPLSRFTSRVGGGSAFFVRAHMKAVVIITSFCLLAVLALGQVYYTNDVTRAEAIRAASRLKIGMWQEAVEKQISTNRLRDSIGCGAQVGWNRSYGLSDGSSLVLDYRVRILSTNGLWGDHGILQSACIVSNSVTIAQIALTNAP